MADPTPTSNASPAAPGMIPAEWPGQAADAIVDVVGKVRDKTTKPAMTAARGAVYGVVVAVGAIVLLVLLLIGSVKALEHLPGHIWTVYLGFAVLFGVPGLVLIRKGNRPAPDPS